MILKVGAFSSTMVASYFIAFLKRYNIFSEKKKILYKVIHERVNLFKVNGNQTTVYAHVDPNNFDDPLPFRIMCTNTVLFLMSRSSCIATSPQYCLYYFKW